MLQSKELGRQLNVKYPPTPRPVAYTMNAAVLFFTNGHCLCSINDYKRGFKHLLRTFYVAGFLIKAQTFKPYKILPCQVLLVLLFCRWRNREFERLTNKPQIRQFRKGRTKTQTMICPTAKAGFLWLVVLPLWLIYKKEQKEESGRTLKWLLEERWDLSANQGM